MAYSIDCPMCGKEVKLHNSYRQGETRIGYHNAPGEGQCSASGQAVSARTVQRCADCREEGEQTGHMGCQYPQNH